MFRPSSLVKKFGKNSGYKCSNYTTQLVQDNVAKRSDWKSVVGLEVHAQIQSSSKLFSGASTKFGEPINSCVSLLDASIPGTLPVLNKKCVEIGVKTAIALSCSINPISMFDRKHYFYADLPAGYQITQQRKALANNGKLCFPVFVPGVTKKPYYKSVRLHQLQLEQDSGKSLHDSYEGKSLVDLNRAGVPLMEFVFEPDLTDGEEAAALVKELVLILTRLNSCSCKMEEGALRVDANVSIHKENTPLGTRTEVKNIGSIRAVAQAVQFEINRQIKILDGGGVIHNETRSWDAVSKTTIAMRDKEVVLDYRFMPEPNLPPLHLNKEETERLKAALPELPEETRTNLMDFHNLSQEVAIILVNENVLYEHFKRIISTNSQRSGKTITNILINDFLTICNKKKLSIEDCKISSEHLGMVVDMLQDERINLHLARLIINEMVESDDDPIEIAKKNNWFQLSDDSEIAELCKQVIEKNPELVKKYKAGKSKLLYALVGQIAKSTDQKADMAKVSSVLKKMLDN